MTVLKGIPSILPPELLLALAKMGHGDELVLADANFPAESVGASTPCSVIRCDALGMPELLSAILKLLPLDETSCPCALMDLMPEHKAAGWQTPIWEQYRAIVAENEKRTVDFELVERFAFYERAKKAFVVVATGEQALYANLILKKGVIGSTGAAS
ncbi:RbsD or FucU transporter [Salpingoeca rosetta]|uniref:L-fucose mutarotase n=1 Tax=Salpingoeca rosetta (strain ATCC 50818 / BSB-021) TaxID=946362 RepID=F2UJC5_SALR5|nr:RbsD or FucU transporter [Salpingoeca rosetta]EGD77224.1 RbsD or FucU transporter [Salpingoeca rosetta]|eukprot:XP_004990568.1 RbsD or FucU transporter [Salpingoeca rosetta]